MSVCEQSLVALYLAAPISIERMNTAGAVRRPPLRRTADGQVTALTTFALETNYS